MNNIFNNIMKNKTLSINKGNPIAYDKKNKNIIYLDETDDKNSVMKEYKYDNSDIIQIPNFSLDREVYYICGPSGSGKSFYARKIIEFIKNKHPNRQIILFSPKDIDPTLEGIRCQKIDLEDKNLINDPLTYKEFKNCICLFDDFEGIENPAIKKLIFSLINRIVLCGRDKNINAVITSHVITNGNKYVYFLNECNYLVIFPRCGFDYQIRTRLKNYFGMSENEINKVLNLNSRWVCIHIKYPRYIISSDSCYLL
jgi:ABC-type dipeptide/oligopeptide/nickel transport system ATPase component